MPFGVPGSSRSSPGHQREYIGIFLGRHVLKASGSRLGAPRMVCEDFLIRCVLKAGQSRPSRVYALWGS